jgi:5-amino-6-(5-phosphoribosylamino)uracil reductase
MVTMTSFETYASRKTAEATGACLQPFVTDVDLAVGKLNAIGNEWSRRFFGGDFYTTPSPDASRPACSLVFVQSLDGNTGAHNPFTLGGGETDKHVIYEGLSQMAADAVLTGADTIRGGDLVFSVWHPELVRLRASLGKPRYPIQIVATLRGVDVEQHLLFNVPGIQVWVLTVAAGVSRMRQALASRPWVRPLVMKQREDLPDAFEALRSVGIERISAVGGRHLATQLIDAGLVQDVYLTTSARTGGEPGTPMYPRPLKARTLVSAHGTGADAGVSFEHLQLDNPRELRMGAAPGSRTDVAL